MSIRFDGAGLDLAMRSFRFFHKAALWAQQSADPRRAVSFFSEKRRGRSFCFPSMRLCYLFEFGINKFKIHICPNRIHSLSKKGYRFVKMHENNFVKFPRYACLFDCPDKGRRIGTRSGCVGPSFSMQKKAYRPCQHISPFLVIACY